MIKKLTGIAVAAAVIVVIVLTVLRSGEYRSMIGSGVGGEKPAGVEVPVVSVPPVQNAPEAVPTGADSLAAHAADSL